MQRYTLDLSALFSDHRAKTFVRRRSQWNRVRCLQDHIRATFQIEPECYLTNEADVFFPEAEYLDVIQEGDLIRVRVSNSCGTQPKSAPKKVSIDEARAQNGKRKHTSTSSSGDDSSSDSDDETLPKIFAGVEKTCKTKDDEAKLEAKPKRKRVRKRKSKKKVEESPPPKVVVKTYGKTKTPPIVVANGDSSGHVRFEESDKDEDEVASVKVEPYRNLNRTVTPRVVKAVRVENGQSWNDDIPAVPEYDGGCVEEVKQVVNGAKSRSRKPAKKSVEIKQETIQAATQPQRDPSPTWDTEVSQDPGKESFIANYSGTEFWASLRASVENFPSIPFPSANDVIAYNVRDSGESYLAFVEHVDEGDASRLTIRRLNCSDAASTESATLKQLTEIRLVATYQPA